MYPQLKLDNQLCYRLYTASRLVTQAYRPLLEPLGLTYAQYMLLMVLWERDRQSVSEICEHMRLASSTVTPLLQRLEQSGLVVRQRDTVDARQTLVCLTKQGQQMEERCREVPSCMVARLSAATDEAGARSLMQTLDNIINTLTP